MSENNSNKTVESINGTNMVDKSSGGGLGANASSAPPIPQKPEPITQKPETNSSRDKQ